MIHHKFLPLTMMVLLAGMFTTAQAQKVPNKKLRNGYSVLSSTKVDNYNFVYVSGSAGYTNLMEDAKDLTSKGGLGYQIGAGYEFRNSGFWLNAGLQYSQYTSTLTVEPFRENRNGIATNGDQAIFHYDVTQQDKNTWHSIGIPVMVGYYKMGFYVGAGAKLDFYLNPKSTSTGQYEMSATHIQSGVTYTNMPNHGYTTYDYKQTHEIQLHPEISVIGEVGYDLLSTLTSTKSTCHILKLGLYVEYGLNSLLKPGSQEERLIVNPNNATQVDVQPSLNMARYEGCKINPLYIGVKLSYVIGGSHTAHKVAVHKGCTCYE